MPMTTRIADAQNFLDLNGLNSIRQQSNADDKASKEAALETAAKQFESIFMQMLLKSMRKAQEVLESDSPFNSESSKFYRDMHDQQLSIELSDNGALGLAPLIVRQLGGDSENFTPHNFVRNDGTLEARGNTRKAPTSLDTVNNTSVINLSATKNGSATQKESPDLIKTLVAETPTFNEPKDFVTALAEPAKVVEQRLNIPFEVVIAQAALETGWGQKILKNQAGESSNNLFNIKADKRWQGDKTQKETLEYEQGSMVKKKESFRSYSSMAESINDYVKFLSTGERYKPALEKVGNVEQFLHNLQGAGYATDPNYAEKIMGTLKTVTSLLNK